MAKFKKTPAGAFINLEAIEVARMNGNRLELTIGGRREVFDTGGANGEFVAELLADLEANATPEPVPAKPAPAAPSVEAAMSDPISTEPLKPKRGRKKKTTE